MVYTREKLIKQFIEFFKTKAHKEIPNSSLIPVNDPTVLFTTAGMHPIVPFLSGQKHSLGKRLVNIQRCIRTGDIEEVGDTTHHTFFEMLGNWSLGDYFKKEAIEYSFEFLTSVLKIPKEKLGVTCFEGDNDAPKDTESASIWQELGISKDRIAFLPKKNNWWGPAGESGPCGPDTEMFYWKPNDKKAPKKFDPEDENWVEIWNDVFMQYEKTKEGKFIPLKQKNVDTGMGVERILSILNNKEDNYLTDAWKPIIDKILEISNFKKYDGNRNIRIVADHVKAAVFIIADGIAPSNTGQGYVLRRIIRRAIRWGMRFSLKDFTDKVAEPVFDIYQEYIQLKENKKKILKVLRDEEEKFNKTLEKGLLVFSKKQVEIIEENQKKQGLTLKIESFGTLSGKEAFLLYQSYGFPPELIEEECKNRGMKFDKNGFEEEYNKHQELSRTTSAGTFKSGLADHSEKTTRLHTATHMLNEALSQVLGPEVTQRGSNITPERTRFDFVFSRKLTDEEVKKIEDIVNKAVSKGLEMKREEMSPKEAFSSGAKGEFGHKYPDKISVFTAVDKSDKRGYFSKEICTGPHVKNTKEIGKIKIIEQSSVSAGVRRIKAIVE